MNITDNLIRIQTAKTDIINSLKNKGVDIPDNTLINEIPTIIDNAEIGGGDTPSQPETPELVQKYEGATVFRINVPTDNYEFAINLCNNASTATYDVDWGDGVLQSGLKTNEQHHTYSKKGTYDVNVYNISKDISLGGSTSFSGSSTTIVYYLFNNTNNDYWLGNVYSYQTENTTVTNVLIGDKITNIGNSAFQNCTSLQSIVIPNSVNSIGTNVFYNCISLQSIVISNLITTISNYTFQNCYFLENITIPNSVTSIGNHAFNGCSSLKSINLPNGVKTINGSAFSGCSSLLSINLPDGITKIDSTAFNNCSSLQNIVIPNSVNSIGSNAFSNCSSLQNIVIPNSVNSIGSNAFSNCSSLQNIVIPEGITKIESSTFSTSTSLSYIELPSSLTSISNSNFNGSYSTSNQLHYIISRAKTAPTIQSNTFQYSASNGILYIPKDADITTYQSSYWKTNLLDIGWTIEYIEDMPEKVPSTLEFTTVNDKLIKVSSLGKGQLISEEKIDNKYIYNFDDTIYLGQNTLPKTLFTTMKFIGGVELGNYCCNDWTTLQSIVIPESVTSIGSSAFDKCSSLQSIVIPESVTSIGSSAFRDCSSLQSIVIPEGVTSIGDYAFLGCTSLQSIVIPESITELKNATFSGCSALENIQLPITLTKLNTAIFRYCSKLESIILPENLNYMGNDIFERCYLLSTITSLNPIAPTLNGTTVFLNVGSSVPSGTPKVLRIPQGASGYEETTSEWYKQLISKGYKVEYIVPNTLNYTSYSGDIVTPYAKSFEGKNEIVSNVYENGIGTVTFKEGLTEIYDEMYNKDVVGALTTIEIPNGVTKIGDYSFRSQYLTTLNVPNSVTYIGDSAFNGCTNLTEITLGSGVETIGQWAFGGCTQVATITCMAMVAPTFNQSFLSVGSNVSGDKILRVPEGAEGYESWLSQLNGFTIEYVN